MNEAETRAELIDPALQAAGWGVVAGSRVYREHITSGRLLGAGKRGTPEIADYVLSFRNHRLAVIEAKRRDLPVTEGLAQAKRYAGKLQTRFAYATNGVGLYQVDMATGAEGHVTAYPGPEALWALVFAQQNDWRDRFAAVALLDKSGSEPARYYQDIAVDPAAGAADAGDRDGEDEDCVPPGVEIVSGEMEFERGADAAAPGAVSGGPEYAGGPGVGGVHQFQRV